MNKKKVMIAIFLTMFMVGMAFAVSVNSSLGNVNTQVATGGLGKASAVNAPAASNTPWQMPTNTMHEPSYTNGTFKLGTDCNPSDLNPFTANSYCDVFLVDQVYQSLLYQLPTGQFIPWLASNYSLHNATGKTFDIETNSTQNYTGIYTFHLRNNVQWTDWTAANASQTYSFSNTTDFRYNANSTVQNETSHTYKSYNTTVMKKYYLQAADVVLSWRMQASIGSWPGVVNVVPNGNLSVKMYVSNPLVLLQTDFTNDILPYHIWVHHDYTTTLGLFNATNNASVAGTGYYGWDMGWSQSTGRVTGEVGNGPFMLQNSYGMPQGSVIPSHNFAMYVNPHFFTQYANKTSGLRQYTPKIYEFDMPFYTSESGLVAAYTQGQIDSTSLAPPPSFLPQMVSTPGSYVYHKLSSAFGFWPMNSHKADAPLNITAFRQALSYATPTAYMASTIEDGYATLSSDTVNPGNIPWNNISAPMYTLNMAKARSLINGTPGMSYSSGKLLYLGNPVSIQIQTTVGSIAPTNIEGIHATEKYWEQLGITVSLRPEAFTTLLTNFIGQMTTNATLYQVLVLGDSTAFGNPSIDCQDTVNPAYAIPAEGYSGPYTAMMVNGHMLSGKAVQSLFVNLSTEAINAVNLTGNNSAEHAIHRLQSLMIEQDTVMNTGYGIDLIPLQTNAFVNYSLTDTEATYLYWTYNLMVIHAPSHPVSVKYKYQLGISAKAAKTGPLKAGEYNNITFTVTNKTDGNKAVPGANMIFGFNQEFGGLQNISSMKAVTSSSGQVTFEFKVSSALDQILTNTYYANGTGPLVSYVNESSAVVAVAYEASHAAVKSNETQVSFNVLNSFANPLKSTEVVQKTTNLKANESDNVTVTVVNGTNNNPVANAYVTIQLYLNGVLVADPVAQTNSTGVVVIPFTVPSAFVTGDKLEINSIASVSPSNNVTGQTGPGYSTVTLTSSAPTPAVSALTDYVIIGIVIAVIVIAGIAAFVVVKRKPKTKQ
jgi:hypothetical protein